MFENSFTLTQAFRRVLLNEKTDERASVIFALQYKLKIAELMKICPASANHNEVIFSVVKYIMILNT